MRSHAKAATAGSNLRRTGAVRLAFATGLVLAAMAVLAAPSVLALSSTTFAKGDGTAASAAGKVNLPKGMSVDQSSGTLYVADYNNHRIDKFDSDGKFLMAWGFGVADGISQEFQTCGPDATPPTSRCFGPNFFSNGGAGNIFPEEVAVDQTSGDVYVVDAIGRRVTKFTSSGEFLLMFGKGVNLTPGTLTPNLCTAGNLAEPGAVCGKGSVGNGVGEFFAAPNTITVDSAGHVWVGDTDRLVQFDSGGNYVSQASVPGGGKTEGLARNSAGDFYVQSASLAGVRKYTPSGSPIDTLTPTQTFDVTGNPESLALDGADNLYIADRPASGEAFFMKFNPAGGQSAQFGAGQVLGTLEVPGVAIGDTAEALYASSTSLGDFYFAQRFSLPEPGPLPGGEHVTALEPTAVSLVATLNPEGHETNYHFEYGTSTGYGQSTPTQTLPGNGFDPEAVQASLSGLTPDTTYHFRLVATNHCNDAAPAEECTVASPDVTFTTMPAVAIDAQWASEITATSAVLNAELDSLGVAAEWWIEYGSGLGYGQSTAESALPASFGDVSVNTLIRDLVPSTTYHYRFVARAERGGTVYTVHGADRSFTTQLSGLGFELADGRAWEMVTPPQKFGALVKPAIEGHIQAAADGNALAYLTVGSIEAAPQGSRAIEWSSALARRGGAGDWHSKDITPPHSSVTPVPLGRGYEYKLFNANLERSLLEPRDTTLLSPEATERTPYLRENIEPAKYTPLTTSKEGFANVPPGTEFGGDPKATFGPVNISGATPDLGHVVLQSAVPLAAGDANSTLYQWTAGQLRPVSAMPADEGGATIGAQLGSGGASARKAISDDGSRVFWSLPSGAGPGGLDGLYVRDMNREETVRLDVVQPGAFGLGETNPIFQGADSDGTVAFFTDGQQLTDDANEDGRDLYRCEVKVVGGELACELTDLTTETVGANESAGVLSLVSGMSDDATRVYLVARGVLDSQPNGMGQSAVSGQPNLYVWQEGSGIRFIAALSAADDRDWGLSLSAHLISAAASPNGRYLAFMSQRSLTGYDNRDAKTGEPNQEVFRYDAATDELICASCNPSGASPVGLQGSEELKALAYDPQRLWDGRALAAVLPEATKLSLSGPSLYRSRSVQDNGRLFFNAADSLVPADSNGNWDVYQYEPTGAGDCTSSSGGAAVSRSAGGCISLISSGTGEKESAFLDASADGKDAFFLTSAQLSVTDEDHEVDIYDARVDGIPATLTPSAECLGEACQPPARVPDDPTPASASFKGQGNVAPATGCPRGKRKVTSKGKSRCVSRKHKRHNTKRKAHGNRGPRR